METEIGSALEAPQTQFINYLIRVGEIAIQILFKIIHSDLHTNITPYTIVAIVSLVVHWK